ncbi:GNAT family N-acetyltransferase [Fulvivirgaceae bacterium BMA12]|uniref:GNAT family N-acetyltransferase n=1 Tax=Agaribacillus aureus TaxID=3051825 RepID=A0ABT8L1V7_9BACT|nr:GNAT family N-acetyltransferase [Fulvivirgaceae bacterium BMA12]
MKTKITQLSASETWILRHNVMWPTKPLDYVKLPKDLEGTHFGLWKDEILVSVVSLFIEDGSAQFRKLATETDKQGNGYGTALLSYVMQYASDQKVSKIWCNARTDKTSFYKKFGMIETDRRFTKGNQDYVIMEKVIWKG